MKLEEVILRGDRASQPAATDVPAGTLYYVTDEGEIERSTAAAWETYTLALGAGVATFLGTPSSANLAAAVTGETGSGALVFGTSPALTTPDLGTPTALVLTSATGLPTTGIVDAAVTFAKIQNADAVSVVGRSANSSGVVDEIAAGANDRVLARTSDSLAFQQLTVGMAPDAVWTFAKIQNADALSVPVRAANSSGVLDELALTDGTSVKRVGTALTAAGFGPVSVSVLTSGTAATYTVPAGVYRLRVTVVGGGGGGGGGDGGSSQAGAGAGGSSGAWAIKVYATTPAATFTYTIGALGAGGTAGNNAGTDGGSSLFDEAGSVVTGTGGKGGASVAAGTTMTSTAGVADVTATGGDVNLTGHRGERGWRFSGTQCHPGMGGNGPFGRGGYGVLGATGGAAGGYGAGGGGGASVDTNDRAGGDGTAGVIIVEEYN